MLAKLTSKNQITLPKAAVEATGSAEYFDVEVRAGQLVLTPVRIQRANVVRAKLAALDLGDNDLAAAVSWARKAGAADTQSRVSQPRASYTAVKTRKKTARKPPAR